MSAYREGGEAPCYKCDRATRELCSTCQQPTCERHLDARRMCGKCDEALYRHMRSGDMAFMWLAPLLMVTAVALGLLVPPLLAPAVALPFVGFPTLLYIRKRQRRAKFFKLMRERGELPGPASEKTEEDVILKKLEKQLEKQRVTTKR